MNLKQIFTGNRDRVLAPPAEENREHDRHDDEDWIQIGQNGLEKDELVLETTSPDIHTDVHEIFTLDANDLDLIEELDLMEVISCFSRCNSVYQRRIISTTSGDDSNHILVILVTW